MEPMDTLSPRELEVAQLIHGGKSVVQSAVTLGLSPKTVRAYLEHIFLKLNITKQTQLAVVVERWKASRPAPEPKEEVTPLEVVS